MALRAHLPHITGKQAAKYVLLPGILPRIRALGGSGFGYLAFLIASVYRAVRILPEGHPYTKPGNIGTFGLRAVIAEAANHVQLGWRNIDQLVIFLAVIAAVIILFLQFAALILLLFSGQAFAAGLGSPDDYSFFITKAPEKDVAFLLLDHVFGIPGFFGSEAPTGTAFHTALQMLFKFYNFAILIIAVLIFLYYVVVVVVETAQTGTPFGQRFNSIYAPLRLVVALGLLVPLNYGLNGAQYVTLYAAKIGSSFATNGWLRFNDKLENPTGEDNYAIIASPVIPDFSNVTEHMALLHACKAAYKLKQNIDIKQYLIVDGQPRELGAMGSSGYMSYWDAVKLTKGGDLKIVYGRQIENPASGPDSGAATRSGTSEVIPYCGVVNIPVSSYDPDYNVGNGVQMEQVTGSVYYTFVMMLAGDAELDDMANKLAIALKVGRRGSNDNYSIDSAKIEEIKDKYQSQITVRLELLYNYAVENEDLKLNDDIKNRGWGGAGIWYNKIAETNGKFLDVLYNLPSASSYPMVLEEILKQKRAGDSGFGSCDAFRPNLANGRPVEFQNAGYDMYYARVMYTMQHAWGCDTRENTTNIFWDAMHTIFGVKGLFDMRCNNADGVNPLAQLTSIGKGLIDSSVRNMAMAMFTAAGGGLLAMIPTYGGDLSAMGQAASGFFVTLATVGLSIGFLLFYILPFMPFLYFFFAVGAWVKEIFEAMVGAPLWALAHIKIDGDGLPGRSAINGYYLIFEIFLRPILIVIGLIGGMIIFSASVAILNEIFDIAVRSLTGVDIETSAMCNAGNSTGGAGAKAAVDDAGMFDKHIIDEFFFTVMYAIFVYMIAMSCFKMIDLVPNAILRYMGGGVTPFADEVQDPAESLGQYAAIGGATIGGKVVGGLRDLSAAGGQAVAGVGDMAQRFGGNKE